ncbi:hypothetical protein ACXWTF_13005 [Thiomicrolovo sp. ZZH C-3]
MKKIAVHDYFAYESYWQYIRGLNSVQMIRDICMVAKGIYLQGIEVKSGISVKEALRATASFAPNATAIVAAELGHPSATLHSVIGTLVVPYWVDADMNSLAGATQTKAIRKGDKVYARAVTPKDKTACALAGKTYRRHTCEDVHLITMIEKDGFLHVIEAKTVEFIGAPIEGELQHITVDYEYALTDTLGSMDVMAKSIADAFDIASTIADRPDDGLHHFFQIREKNGTVRTSGNQMASNSWMDRYFSEASPSILFSSAA